MTMQSTAGAPLAAAVSNGAMFPIEITIRRVPKKRKAKCK
jgi:hypothetical protein